jgi:hypothetical protein
MGWLVRHLLGLSWGGGAWQRGRETIACLINDDDDDDDCSMSSVAEPASERASERVRANERAMLWPRHWVGWGGGWPSERVAIGRVSGWVGE